VPGQRLFHAPGRSVPQRLIAPASDQGAVTPMGSFDATAVVMRFLATNQVHVNGGFKL
jgi:hypothetical protein